MRYRAECDCTDFDGRFYARGQEADLSPETLHSDHLIPLEADSAPELEETEPEEEKEAAPKRARRKTKQAGA